MTETSYCVPLIAAAVRLNCPCGVWGYLCWHRYACVPRQPTKDRPWATITCVNCVADGVGMPKVNNGHLAGTNRTQVYPEQKMGPGTVWADVV